VPAHSGQAPIDPTGVSPDHWCFTRSLFNSAFSARRRTTSSSAIGINSNLNRMARPSIYEFAGGHDAFLALAAATHERCLQDPELNHPFSHHVGPHHLENLAAYWAEVLGGPQTYSRNLGGHSGMLSIHAGEGAPDEMGDRFEACFVQAMDDAGLPDDAEFRKTMRAYMHWATREVNSYAPAGTRVEPDLPMPRWSWEGLVTT
jgi:hemoglobin